MTTKTIEETVNEIFEELDLPVGVRVNDIKHTLTKAIAHERAARVVSEEAINILAVEYEAMPSLTGKMPAPFFAFKAGFIKALELNSIVALDELLPSETELSRESQRVGMLRPFIINHLKEKLGLND